MQIIKFILKSWNMTFKSLYAMCAIVEISILIRLRLDKNKLMHTNKITGKICNV